MNPVNANTSGSAHTLLRIACRANNRPIIPPSDSSQCIGGACNETANAVIPALKNKVNESNM